MNSLQGKEVQTINQSRLIREAVIRSFKSPELQQRARMLLEKANECLSLQLERFTSSQLNSPVNVAHVEFVIATEVFLLTSEQSEPNSNTTLEMLRPKNILFEEEILARNSVKLARFCLGELTESDVIDVAEAEVLSPRTSPAEVPLIAQPILKAGEAIHTMAEILREVKDHLKSS